MSRISTKAPRVNELIETLERLNHSDVLHDLELVGLARDAKALMTADVAGAHTVLGGIAGIKGDAAEVRRHYKIALEQSGRRPTTLGNYATALGQAGELDESFSAIVEAHERAPDDLELLQHAIFIAGQGGHFIESASLYERWNRLQPSRPMEDEATMRQAASAAGRGVFSEVAARKVIRIAHEVRLSVKVRQAGSTMHTVWGEPDKFALDMHVHASPGEAAHLNEMLADRVVEDDELMAELRLNFTPMFIGTSTDGSDSRATA